jgi:hypothetical protein
VCNDQALPQEKQRVIIVGIDIDFGLYSYSREYIQKISSAGEGGLNA